MQTLVFNTTEKTITLTEGHRGQSTIIQKMENLSQNYLYKANADFPVLFDSDPAE